VGSPRGEEVHRRANLRLTADIQTAGTALLASGRRLPRRLTLVPVEDKRLRHLFDAACNEIHYAGVCRRVGRLLRLAIVSDAQWTGGIVLGSTFPNIRARDDAFGLTRFISGWQDRGLISPWASENTDYWSRLQAIVNHARTFVFPSFNGASLGVRAHRELLGSGLRHWTDRYGGRVHGLDTLCTHPTSRLFLDNGWTLVGKTKGYSRDPSTVLSRRASDEDWMTVRENAGLSLSNGNRKWWIWVRVLRRF
jgi:hypothetical protein